MRLLLAGDRRALDAFFAAYFPRLYRFALRRVDGHEADCEEVVQITLVAALRGLHGWRGEATLFTWLCTLCRHEIGALHRRRGRIAAVELREADDDFDAATESLAAAERDEPLAGAERDERARRIRAVLDHLPPRYGDVLEWKYLEGLTMEEIAKRMETGVVTVQSLLARARRAFRDGMLAVEARAEVVTLDRRETPGR